MTELAGFSVVLGRVEPVLFQFFSRKSPQTHLLCLTFSITAVPYADLGCFSGGAGAVWESPADTPCCRRAAASHQAFIISLQFYGFCF